jgi:hypothetical protein
LGDLEDAADPIYLAALQKLPTYWMLYFFGQAMKSEDFIKIEAQWATQEEAAKKMKEAEEVRQKEEQKPDAPVAEAPPTA